MIIALHRKITLQPTDERVNSNSSKTLQYFLHSTSHSKSYDQQILEFLLISLSKRERTHKTIPPIQSDWGAKINVQIGYYSKRIFPPFFAD